MTTKLVFRISLRPQYDIHCELIFTVPIDCASITLVREMTFVPSLDRRDDRNCFLISIGHFTGSISMIKGLDRLPNLVRVVVGSCFRSDYDESTLRQLICSVDSVSL